MTFKEMTEECIALLGEEYSASEEEVRSLHVRLGKCVNYAYERIARQYYHPVKTENAVTDERCRLKKSELSESFWYLRGVKCAGQAGYAQAQPVRDNRGAGQRKAEADPFKREGQRMQACGAGAGAQDIPCAAEGTGADAFPDGGERRGQRFYRSGAHGGVYGGESVTK